MTCGAVSFGACVLSRPSQAWQPCQAVRVPAQQLAVAAWYRQALSMQAGGLVCSRNVHTQRLRSDISPTVRCAGLQRVKLKLYCTSDHTSVRVYTQRGDCSRPWLAPTCLRRASEAPQYSTDRGHVATQAKPPDLVTRDHTHTPVHSEPYPACARRFRACLLHRGSSCWDVLYAAQAQRSAADHARCTHSTAGNGDTREPRTSTRTSLEQNVRWRWRGLPRQRDWV